MAEIVFDPELMRNIKIIYGDANLNGNTLKQLHTTWQTNPDIIRNAAQQKMPEIQKAGISISSTVLPTRLQQREIADDDLRGIKGFGAAFKEARRRGLKQFKWGKGVYGTQLASSTKTNATKIPNLRPLPKPSNSGSGFRNLQDDLKPRNEYIKYQTYNKKYPRAGESMSWNPEVFPMPLQIQAWQNRDDESAYGNEKGNFYNNRGFSKFEVLNNKLFLQQGGVMNNREELQKAFIAYLIQDAAAQGVQLQSEQDLEQYAQQLGEEGIKAKYQEFMQKMQGGIMAKLGAKLQYYKKLKGDCPEGEKLVYFEKGGRICKACQKVQKGTKVAKNAVDKFKEGRAQYKKDMKSAKDEATRDSLAINKYNDQETMVNKGNKGNFKNGKWIPNRKKYTGSKMK